MKLLKLFLLITFASSLGWADPVEKTVVRFERTAASSNVVRANFLKNAYRTEVVQVPYIERIPYETTETYYEDVPYTVTVPYQDTETYYETEYQCRNVTDYRNECNWENQCRTEYERECRNEPVCHSEPGRQECSVERICRRGQNGDVCFDKEVCRVVGGGGRVCEDNNVCRTVPRQVCSQQQVCRSVPYSRQECSNVSVPRTRTVTRYREETHYRQEERTRTVTRYREETRCCRPEEKLVYDHQWAYELTLRIDPKAQLIVGETEQFKVEITGGENAPEFVLHADNTHVFKYELVIQTLNGAQGTADIVAKPKYRAQDIGSGTIESINLDQEKDETKVIHFIDKGLRSRVETKYHLWIVREGQTLAESEITAGSESLIKWPLASDVILSGNFDVIIDVYRSGPNLDEEVSFREKQTLSFLNEDELKDARNLQLISIIAEKSSDPVLLWNDMLVGKAAAKNTFTLELYDGSTLLAFKKYAERDLVRGSTGAFITKMSQLGLSSKTIKKSVVAGRTLKVRLQVQRILQDGLKIFHSQTEANLVVK